MFPEPQRSLIRMADSLRKEMGRFRAVQRKIKPWLQSLSKYHQQIVRCLKMKDVGSARKVLNDHIDHAKKETQKELGVDVGCVSSYKLQGTS